MFHSIGNWNTHLYTAYDVQRVWSEFTPENVLFTALIFPWLTKRVGKRISKFSAISNRIENNANDNVECVSSTSNAFHSAQHVWIQLFCNKWRLTENSDNHFKSVLFFCKRVHQMCSIFAENFPKIIISKRNETKHKYNVLTIDSIFHEFAL